MILDEIYAYKLKEIAENKRLVSIESLKDGCKDAPEAVKSGTVLKKDNRIKFIAEVKKASPSAGIIRADFNYINIAMEYEAGGASAISVLTDKEFFKGDIKYLSEIKKTVSVPVLRKDFIIDPYQIYEARAAGADLVLLIARILTKEQIEIFLLEKVLETESAIIGINNRNLDTFETNLETTLQLCHRIPEDKIIVSESGIKTRADVLMLEEAGIDAILIGETLMRSEDISRKIKELFCN